MVTTGGARPELAGNAEVRTPAEMDAMYRRPTTEWSLNEHIAKDIARRERISVGAALVRLGYTPTVGRLYDRDFPPVQPKPEPETPEQVSLTADEARRAHREQSQRAYDMWNEAAAAAEAAELNPQSSSRAAWQAAKGLAGKIANPNRPSQTPEGRRQRLLEAHVKAGRYPDMETAERLVPRR